MVRFGILGPLEVSVGDTDVEVRRGIPRTLLIALILRAGETVSAGALMELLWADDQPQNPANALQIQVSYLRKVLGAACGERGQPIVTRAGGYALEVTPDQIDARRFDCLVQEAATLQAGGTAADLEAALGALDAALALWRGEALADVAGEPFALGEITRLEEARWAAIEARNDVLLDLGRHRELIGKLGQLINRQPLRERLYEQLMLALYRSGRQADALRAFGRARAVLVDELGLDPGRRLQQLEGAILAHDAALDWLAPPAPDAIPELPGRTHPTAGASGSDGLLATKLYAPRVPPDFVPRPRLVDQLDEALAQGLTLVCAPAGFGKTALVADWTRRARRPVAWLSLDPGDNDPARFWRHATAALDRVHPGIAERAIPLLGPPAPPSFEALVTALINELVARAGEGHVVLVLDDYHVIDSQPVHASLAFLLEHRPPELHLILTSRADPPLPLARLRGRGQLAELRAAELRFTSEEAAALLRHAVGPDRPLPGGAVATLTTRTEGWAAGLHLAALTLRRQSDIAGFVATFSGSHRYVLDYLTDEVLADQPEPVREFLLETSVLERLSGELCDAVTGRSDGQRMLEAIERANLFLVPLDEVRGWWRYHPMFADLLRARLQQERPQHVPELHRNAASWCERSGLPDDTIRHALAAGDAVWAARVIERYADSRLLLSEGATLQRWLAAVPAELARSRPRLSLAQANLEFVTGDVEAFEVPLDAAETALTDASGMVDEPFEPSVGRAASLLTNLPATIALGRSHVAELRGDAERTAAFASRAQAMLEEGEWALELLVRAHRAVAEFLRGQLPEAERDFAWSFSRWRAAGDRVFAMRAGALLGQVQRAQGRLDAALETYEQALGTTAPPGEHRLPTAGAAHVGMAEVAYQRDEPEAALQQVTEGIGLCRQLVDALRGAPQPLATGLATLAWIRQASGDADGAREAIAEAEAAAPDPGVASLLNPVSAQRARLLLAQGALTDVLRWTNERGLDPEEEVSYPREPEHLVLARVLLVQDLPDQALALLDRLHTAAAAQGRKGSIIEIQVLRALALAARSQEADALAALAEALSLAYPQGYVRVFADEGAPMGALLGRVLAAQRSEPGIARNVPLNYLGRLMRSSQPEATAGAPHARRSGAALPSLVEALSERELEVLRLVAAGKPNREIAEELYVALDTVKKHVAHIFEKLGAANRTEATARARELGLVP